ncbi:MAG: hypothetical protein FWG48_00965 [Oscillospiraceae bacterium]|nr:hypothetical protein [Oscillospiraceae bacterium]
MGLFDKIKEQGGGAAEVPGGQPPGFTGGANRVVPIVFASMPETLAEFTALPQAALQSPFDTSALVVAALCVYPLDKDACIAMINYLSGPSPMSQRDLQFLRDRMAQNNKARFIGASYFSGATPQNDYMPSQPYTVTVSEHPYSYAKEGVVSLNVRSGGADSARSIETRLAKDGKWYIWQSGYHALLVDIRQPESTNPWA